MFKVRCTTGFKFLKFFAPIYKCYKVVETGDGNAKFFCYRWDYGRFEWIHSDNIRPVFKIDGILQWVVIILIISMFL